MTGADGSPGPATNLLRSLARLGGTLLALAETRVDLLTTEISEDAQRGVRVLLWAFAAMLAVFIGLILAAVTVVIVFWDTHRVAAAVAVTTAFLVLAALAALLSRKRLREKPRLLDATRTELRRDVELLRGRR